MHLQIVHRVVIGREHMKQRLLRFTAQYDIQMTDHVRHKVLCTRIGHHVVQPSIRLVRLILYFRAGIVLQRDIAIRVTITIVVMIVDKTISIITFVRYNIQIVKEYIVIQQIDCVDAIYFVNHVVRIFGGTVLVGRLAIDAFIMTQQYVARELIDTLKAKLLHQRSCGIGCCEYEYGRHYIILYRCGLFLQRYGTNEICKNIDLFCATN